MCCCVLQCAAVCDYCWRFKQWFIKRTKRVLRAQAREHERKDSSKYCFEQKYYTMSDKVVEATSIGTHTLQHTATHCNTLQHTATHCNTLQHTATHCNTSIGTHTSIRTNTYFRVGDSDIFLHIHIHHRTFSIEFWNKFDPKRATLHFRHKSSRSSKVVTHLGSSGWQWCNRTKMCDVTFSDSRQKRLYMCHVSKGHVLYWFGSYRHLLSLLYAHISPA